MTYRNRAAIVTSACLVIATFATACSSGSPEAGRPDSTPTPPAATSSATPTTTPQPSSPAVPPHRPANASGLTLAAAEAFIGYYVSLQNYAYLTGDPQYMLDQSDQGCLGCKGIGDFVRISNGRNGGLSGDYLDHLVSVKEVTRGTTGRVAGSAEVRTGAYRERPSPSASLVDRAAGSATMEFSLSSSGSNWIMYEVEIVE